jgi:hypothetical protein
MAPIPDKDFPLNWYVSWQPFRLDALGLITLLGADEVARAVGSLAHNTLTDYLPLFGAFKIASDQIATIEPGFSLYNISDGIWVTELAPWLTRWLSSHLESNYTILRWCVCPGGPCDWKDDSTGEANKAEKQQRSNDGPFPTTLFWQRCIAIVLGILLNLGLAAFAAVQADWYGTANSGAMIGSVLVRAYMTRTYRFAIDRRTPKEIKPGLKSKKIIIVLPDGRLAISYVPGSMIGVMLDSKTRFPWAKRLLLLLARAVGWAVFGIQVIAIGQSSLLSQMCTVAVMTTASVFTIFNIGVQRPDHVAHRLHVHQLSANASGRKEAYLMLEPTKEEKAFMLRMGLVPDEGNFDWWVKWHSTEADYIELKDGWTFGNEQWAEERSKKEAGRWAKERDFLGLVDKHEGAAEAMTVVSSKTI